MYFFIYLSHNTLKSRECIHVKLVVTRKNTCIIIWQLMMETYNTKIYTSLNEYISICITELFFNGFVNTQYRQYLPVLLSYDYWYYTHKIITL